MVRVVAQITANGIRYVGLYCNTMDNMVSPTFDDWESFSYWLNNDWPEEERKHAYWINDAKVWLGHVV